MSTSQDTQPLTQPDNKRWSKLVEKYEEIEKGDVLDDYEGIIQRAAMFLSKEQPQEYSEIIEKLEALRSVEDHEEKVKGYEVILLQTKFLNPKNPKPLDATAQYRKSQIWVVMKTLLEEVRKKNAGVHETAIIKAKDEARRKAMIKDRSWCTIS
jgi:hypothetical protein